MKDTVYMRTHTGRTLGLNSLVKKKREFDSIPAYAGQYKSSN